MPKFTGMPPVTADAYRAGGLDAYGNPPETKLSDGSAPCRCCLAMIPDGKPMLVLAYRPFEGLHAYAETGPVFLCAEKCRPKNHNFPQVIVSPDYLLKAYSADERIIYGTGQITPKSKNTSYCEQLLAHKDVAFIDLRSARNNRWQARITRDQSVLEAN